MKTFAFLTHLDSVKELKKLWLATRYLPDSLAAKFLKKMPESAVFKLNIGCFAIILNLLPQEITKSSDEYLVAKIQQAAQTAHKLGCRLIGLGGLLAERRYKSAKKFDIGIANSGFLTAWSMVEAVYRIAAAKKLDLKNLSAVVIAADNPAGQLCARKLEEYCSRVSCDTDPGQADIVVIASRLKNEEVNLQELKPQAIVCGFFISQSENYRKCSRSDLAVVDAGLIKLPFEFQYSCNSKAPAGVVCADFAETMLLAREDKIVGVTLNSNTNIELLEEAADMACRNHFEIWVPQAPIV